jgi:hypothetical protein
MNDQVTSPLPSTTFVFCVESGHFEAQTLLAVECLRRFGGRLAQAPVLAVTPRMGPRLDRESLAQFARLGVRYIRRDYPSRYSWYPYMNKAFGALVADEEATTDQVIWLDSDVLVVREPTALLLADQEDFTICAVDKNVGSAGVHDPNEAYWQAIAALYGLTVDSLPWVDTAWDRQRVRFRLHSGVYAYRRGKGLGRAFVDDMETMLGGRIAYSTKLPFPGDDVALAFSIVRLNLRWRLLPMSHNYEVGPRSDIYRRDQVGSQRILHYHHSLNRPDDTAWLLAELEAEFPEVASWLRRRVPLNAQRGGVTGKIIRRMLHEMRKASGKRHAAECRAMVAES